MVIAVRTMLAAHPRLNLVAAAPTVAELLDGGAELDLVILDLRLADGSSPTGNVADLHAAGLPTLVFTGAENPYLVRLAAKAGVLGVIRKSAPTAVVVDAVSAAAAGEQVVTTEWAAAIDGDPLLDAVGLSERQREVLALYASGEKADRVARMTGLSAGTVNDYLRRIRTKYRETGRPAETKIDLYRRAVEDGWLPVPERPAR